MSLPPLYTMPLLVFISTKNILLATVLAPVIISVALAPFNRVLINMLVNSGYL